MPSATRTVKVRFDGTATDLVAAGKEGERAIRSFRREAERRISPDVNNMFADVFASIPTQLKGAAIAAAVALGASMAPALASTIISGVLLVMGGGALAAGIIAAAKNPKVISAWKKVGKQAAAVWHKFAQPFVGPLTRAAKVFGDALKRAEPTIMKIAKVMAPAVDRLAPALAGIAERAMPGFLAAAEAGIPFLEALLDPRLGDALTGFFTNIAAGAPNALAFFEKFMGFVRDILPKLGGFLSWLSDLGVKMDAFWKSPEFTGLRDALKSFASDTLAGVKVAIEFIGTALKDNAAKWKEAKDNVAAFIEFAGPGFGKLMIFIGAAAATGIQILSYLALWISKVLEALTKLDAFLDKMEKRTGFGKMGNVDVGKLFTTGLLQQLFGYAGGGYGRGLVMTGEKGRELVDLGSGGRVYNHSDTEKIMAVGETVINNIIEIGGEVVRVVKTVVSENNRAVKRSVLAGAR